MNRVKEKIQNCVLIYSISTGFIPPAWPYRTILYVAVLKKKSYRYISRYIYSYFLPRYEDRHIKLYFFGNGKYTVTPTVTAC